MRNLKPKVLFRADGNHDIGYGHVMRSLSLAFMLKDEFECDFAVIDPDSFLKKEISNVGKCIPLENNQIGSIYTLCQQYNIIVLDGYHFDTSYQLALKKLVKPLVYIVDMPDKRYVSDVLINHAPGLDFNKFETEGYTKKCFGLAYSMIRPEFQIEKKQNGDAIFLCFGGADKHNLTFRVLEILQKIVATKINVVIGSGYIHESSLRRLAHKNMVEIHKAISGNQMCELMDLSRLAIVPSSTILFETLSRSLETISGYYIENQVNIYNGFKKEGLIHSYGNFLELENFEEFFRKVDRIENNEKEKKPVVDTNSIRKTYIDLFKDLVKDA